MTGGLYQIEAAQALGVKPETLARARRAGVVHPRRGAGRAFLYSDADLAAFRAYRSGLCQKAAAAMLGVSTARITELRRSGELAGRPIAGKRLMRYVYDPADVARLRNG